MIRIRALILAVIGAPVMALAVTTGTASATPQSATAQPFQATFVDIYSQCPTHPPPPVPTVVFCGEGNVAGVGKATSIVTALSGHPIGPCLATTAVRTITLDDGDGSVTLNESGTKCPTSAAADAEGAPFKVDTTYTIAHGSGTGVFADVTGGSGTVITHSAGNSQVSVISGTITTA